MTSREAPAPAGHLLRWVQDSEPGFRRVTSSRGFKYVDIDGKRLNDAKQLQRIQSLAIPPAYQDVWICPWENGHLQATGRDARGRKQYRYHSAWLQSRGQTKFDTLRSFGRALPRLRARVAQELHGDDTPTRDRVLATLVLLLDTTWIRIGNTQYARENGSYGLTTLQRRHARLAGGSLRLSFAGKSGVRHQLTVDDRRIASIVRRCRDLPGQELFQYVGDDGGNHCIDSSDVNRWLSDTSKQSLTAKHFRTWHGSVLALQLLTECATPRPDSTRRLAAIIAEVAVRLGNTPAVCRKAYIHPKVLAIAALLDQDMALQSYLRRQRWMRNPPSIRGLNLAERRLIGLLDQRSDSR